MSTESFDKTFVVTDPKAIEQFLYDLEHGERMKYPIPTVDEQKKQDILAILKNRLQDKLENDK